MEAHPTWCRASSALAVFSARSITVRRPCRAMTERRSLRLLPRLPGHISPDPPSIPGPYKLDSRSLHFLLTIENKGPLSRTNSAKRSATRILWLRRLPRRMPIGIKSRSPGPVRKQQLVARDGPIARAVIVGFGPLDDGGVSRRCLRAHRRCQRMSANALFIRIVADCHGNSRCTNIAGRMTPRDSRDEARCLREPRLGLASLVVRLVNSTRWRSAAAAGEHRRGRFARNVRQYFLIESSALAKAVLPVPTEAQSSRMSLSGTGSSAFADD